MRNLNDSLVKCYQVGNRIEVESRYFKNDPAVKTTILRYYANEIKRIIKT